MKEAFNLIGWIYFVRQIFYPVSHRLKTEIFSFNQVNKQTSFSEDKRHYILHHS